MKRDTLRSADLLTGIIFVVIGIYICYQSMGMFYVQRIKMQSMAAWYNSPGLSPLIIGAIFTFLGGMLIIIAIKDGGTFEILIWNRIKKILKMSQFKKGFLVVLLIGIYIFVLLDRLPFFLSSFIFLIATMGIFRADKWYKILLYSAILSWFVTFIFGTVARIPLPGGMLRIPFLPGV